MTEIAKIEARYLPSAAIELTPDAAIDRALILLPVAKASDVVSVRAAVIAHRAELPATFDALQSFIELEIDRLQRLNYVSDEQRDICVQQIKTLRIINSAAARLSALVPADASVQPDAEQIQGLGQVWLNNFKAWPRESAAGLVDTTCRLAIAGGGAVIAQLLGLPGGAAQIIAAAYLAPAAINVAIEVNHLSKKLPL